MRFIILIVFIALSSPASGENKATITGTATIVNNATIAVGEKKIRLWGIDVPTARQMCKSEQHFYSCGMIVTRVLKSCIGKEQSVVCKMKYKDQDGKIVAICYEGNRLFYNGMGQDIGECLIERGFAFDWPKYSKGYYAEAQKKAINQKAGLWVGEFILPREWEQKKRDFMAPTNRLLPFHGE